MYDLTLHVYKKNTVKMRYNGLFLVFIVKQVIIFKIGRKANLR